MPLPRPLLPAALVASALLLAAPEAHGQAHGTFGIGGQLGEPTGLALKLGVGRGALDMAAGWDLGRDHLFVQGHYLLAERRLPGAEVPLGLFYGPGLFLAVYDRPGGGDVEAEEVAFGFSFNVGLNYYTGPIELFGQVTPRLQLVEDTDFDFGGAIGLRFYP